MYFSLIFTCSKTHVIYNQNKEYIFNPVYLWPLGCIPNVFPMNIHYWRVSTAGYGSVQSAMVRYGSRFHCQKVGVTRTEPYSLAVLLRWGTETLKGYRQFPELHTLSVDWSTESALPCDRGIITNKHSTRKVFLDNGESFVY